MTTASGEKKKTVRRKKKSAAEAASRGLTPAQTASGAPPAKIESLRQEIQRVFGIFLRRRSVHCWES